MGAIAADTAKENILAAGKDKAILLAGPLHFIDYWTPGVQEGFWSFLSLYSRGPGIVAVDILRTEGIEGPFVAAWGRPRNRHSIPEAAPRRNGSSFLMSHLSEWVLVSQDEKPYVNFEESLEVDQVAAGYVPVRSTLEVFDFLREAVGLTSPRRRAVICHGTYGTGKSRLCTVLARLFRDGFDCPGAPAGLGPLEGTATAGLTRIVEASAGAERENMASMAGCPAVRRWWRRTPVHGFRPGIAQGSATGGAGR